MLKSKSSIINKRYNEKQKAMQRVKSDFFYLQNGLAELLEKLLKLLK